MKRKKETQNIIIVFLDTDILMHFQKLDLIPWLKILKAEEVRIILVPLNFDQLEEKRYDQNPITRERAETAIKEIKYFLNDNVIATLNNNVTLTMAIQNEELNILGFSADNRLIESIYQYESKYNKVLITNDYLLRQRAKTKGIETPELDENKYRRPFKDDSKTRQIVKLTNENEQLKKEIKERDEREPKLDLKFDDGSLETTHDIINPNNRYYTKDLLKNKIIPILKDTPKSVDHSENRSTILVWLILENIGHYPAEGIEIKINIILDPESFDVFPARQTNTGIYIIKHVKNQRDLEIIKKRDQFVIMYKLNELLHTKSVKWFPFAILVKDWDKTEKIDTFVMDYEILARNIRGKKTEKLTINIQRDRIPT